MKTVPVRGLYQRDLAGRIAALEAAGLLSASDAELLRRGRHVLRADAADAMVENVVGVFGLPLAIAPNFLVNGREHLVPLAVEEPSVVAALSAAGKLARRSGGFFCDSQESLLTGQVHVIACADPGGALARLQAAREQLLAEANAVHPRLVARGGGVRELELRTLLLDDGGTALVVHFLVDTRDAMGANLVNTLCEAMAPRIAALCGGQVALRILSNLADRALVTARARFALADLGRDDTAARRARDGIVMANRIANADPYRAATHNKGVMNGIDPLAIATGNDWRAIEAGAHAFAARDGQYRALTQWWVDDDGDLAGRIELPLKPGTVGGTLANNPGAALGLRICAAQSACELAELMAAVGLAQNFSALRALATTGIQAGHMRLHARSVAAAATAARDSAADATEAPALSATGGAAACGKVILFGEHAVVYGRHALALPIPDAVRAVATAERRPVLEIPDWQVRCELDAAPASELAALVRTAAAGLGIAPDAWSILVRTSLPRAMGLGSSAAIAVAVIRALARAAGIEADVATVNAIAFECEKLAHGTPSGVDNTLASYGTPLLFRRGVALETASPGLARLPPIVIACGNMAGATREQVAAVRERYGRDPERYERLFDEFDALCLEGTAALREGDYDRAGALMDLNHGLLNAIGVSTPELEDMVSLARAAGARGAKLTGAGGGGSIVALCPDGNADVAGRLAAAGYRTLCLETEGKL